MKDYKNRFGRCSFCNIIFKFGKDTIRHLNTNHPSLDSWWPLCDGQFLELFHNYTDIQ